GSTPFKDCDKDGFICDTRGLPFVSIVGAVTDYCGGLVAECPFDTKNPPPGATTAHRTKPAPATGRVCLSGTVGTGGWATMVLPFSTGTPDGNRYLTNLNAEARGITEVDFTIDSPLTGIVVAGAATTPPPPLDCPNASCFTSFDLETAPLSGVRATFTQPGPQVAP